MGLYVPFSFSEQDVAKLSICDIRERSSLGNKSGHKISCRIL